MKIMMLFVGLIASSLSCIAEDSYLFWQIYPQGGEWTERPFDYALLSVTDQNGAKLEAQGPLAYYDFAGNGPNYVGTAADSEGRTATFDYSYKGLGEVTGTIDSIPTITDISGFDSHDFGFIVEAYLEDGALAWTSGVYFYEQLIGHIWNGSASDMSPDVTLLTMQVPEPTSGLLLMLGLAGLVLMRKQKKLLALVGVSAAIFVDAAPKAVVQSANTFGIAKYASSKKLEIVAVPWAALSLKTEEEAIRVDELIKAATLDNGDKIHVYNPSTSSYYSWVYEGESGWRALQTIKIGTSDARAITAPSVHEVTISRGSAFWLERQDASKPFYLYGQHAATSVTTAIAANRHNMLANPRSEDLNLNEPGLFTGVIAANKDQIIVPQDGKNPIIYMYNATKKQWGAQTMTISAAGIPKSTWTPAALIPRGTGFWYVSKGGNPTVNW